jgi:acetyl-CoA acyltransferase
MDRNPCVDWDAVDDTILARANQADEDNRNVARMAVLLAGVPEGASGSTINRLYGSGLDTIGSAARGIRSGDAEFMIAGGVESMTRTPLCHGQGAEPFYRAQKLEDHAGLAFRQPGDAACLWRRLDAGDWRERR